MCRRFFSSAWLALTFNVHDWLCRALPPLQHTLRDEPEPLVDGFPFGRGVELDRRHATSPQVFEGWQASFVDGAGGKSIFPRMWERLQPTVDGSVVVTLDEVKNAMRLAASKARVIAEGAGALSIAAALRQTEGPVVAVVSGGNIDLKKFCEIVTG